MHRQIGKAPFAALYFEFFRNGELKQMTYR